jgi:hypothetical protein
MAYKKKDERAKNEQHESRLKTRVGLNSGASERIYENKIFRFLSAK